MTRFYEIRIEGRLDAQWQDWFDGMSVRLEADGTTLLAGPVPDQPALHGLLRKVRDLGLTLVSVTLLKDIKNQNRPHLKVRPRAHHTLNYSLRKRRSPLALPAKASVTSADLCKRSNNSKKEK